MTSTIGIVMAVIIVVAIVSSTTAAAAITIFYLLVFDFFLSFMSIACSQCIGVFVV